MRSFTHSSSDLRAAAYETRDAWLTLRLVVRWRLFQIGTAIIRFIQKGRRRGHPRIVIPFVRGMLAPETKALGEQLRAEFVDVTGDDTAYFALFERLWDEGEGFLVVEQDVVPSADLLAEMDACDQEWCSGFYVNDSGIPVSQWLGCAKFSSSLIRRRPDVMRHTAGRASRRHFNQLDLALFEVLSPVGFRGAHLHHPPVRHMHLEMERRRAAAGLAER